MNDRKSFDVLTWGPRWDIWYWRATTQFADDTGEMGAMQADARTELRALQLLRRQLAAHLGIAPTSFDFEPMTDQECKAVERERGMTL